MLRLRLRLLLRSLNPFEVREVLQDFEKENRRVWCVSIPLKSGRCCKYSVNAACANTVSIPLKSGRCCKQYPLHDPLLAWCLNPFEVREVLQVGAPIKRPNSGVSIPLKSGRCCKNTHCMTHYQRGVSIPLKSGRCCKDGVGVIHVPSQSQSL